MSQPEGALLAQRYRLVAEIGRGGMGTVWRAHDGLLDRDVAVKEVKIPPGISDDERALLHERTLREARATARLGHPGIVTVHDVVDEDERPWIVMELVRARPLQDVIDEGGPMPPRRAAEIGRQVLAALRTAHAAQILHRDVKPSNVLLVSDAGEDRAVLTDFGIAAVEGDTTLTQTGLIMGSPAYIAPERVQGGRAGPAADLWALGATIYAAVEGRPAYRRPDAMSTLAAILMEDPPPPRNAGPLAPVIHGLLVRDPASRVTAEAAADQLGRIARGGETTGTGAALPGTVPAPVPPAAPPPGHAAPLGPASGHSASGTPLPGTAPHPGTPGTGGPYGTAAGPRADESWMGRYDAAPGSPPAAAPRPGGKGTRTGLLVGLAAAVGVAVVIAGVLLLPSTGGGRRQNGAGQGGSGQGGSASATPRDTPIPAGFRAARGPGFTITVPQGWRRREDSRGVKWISPSGAYVQVDRTPWSGDPYAHWQWFERQVRAEGSLPEFTRVSLKPIFVDGHDAADLEFTWRDSTLGRMRGYDRGFIAGGQSYAIFFAAPAARWSAYERHRQTALGSFRPGTDVAE